MVATPFQVWGLEIALRLSPLRVVGSNRGKGGMSTMKAKPRTTQKMAREAFGLLLELRERENAPQLLTQAIAFLEMLGQGKGANAAPIMLSVQVMQLRKS